MMCLGGRLFMGRYVLNILILGILLFLVGGLDLLTSFGGVGFSVRSAGDVWV